MLKDFFTIVLLTVLLASCQGTDEDDQASSFAHWVDPLLRLEWREESRFDSENSVREEIGLDEFTYPVVQYPNNLNNTDKNSVTVMSWERVRVLGRRSFLVPSRRVVEQFLLKPLNSSSGETDDDYLELNGAQFTLGAGDEVLFRGSPPGYLLPFAGVENLESSCANATLSESSTANVSTDSCTTTDNRKTLSPLLKRTDRAAIGIRFSGRVPSNVTVPSWGATPALINNSGMERETASRSWRARGVGPMRIFSVKGNHHVDFGAHRGEDQPENVEGDWDGFEATVSFALRADSSSEGLIFVLSDAIVDDAIPLTRPNEEEYLTTNASSLTELTESTGNNDQLLDELRHFVTTGLDDTSSGTPLSNKSTVSGLYLSAQRGRLTWFSGRSTSLPSRLDIAIPAYVTDGQWHSVALRFNSLLRYRFTQLFVDGEQVEELCRLDAGAALVDLAEDPSIDNDELQSLLNSSLIPSSATGSSREPRLVAYRNGMLTLGDLNASLYALQFHAEAVSQRYIVSLGADWMREHLPIQKDVALGFGIVLVIFALLFMSSTLVQAVLEIGLGEWFERKAQRNTLLAWISAKVSRKEQDSEEKDEQVQRIVSENVLSIPAWRAPPPGTEIPDSDSDSEEDARDVAEEEGPIEDIDATKTAQTVVIKQKVAKSGEAKLKVDDTEMEEIQRQRAFKEERRRKYRHRRGVAVEDDYDEIQTDDKAGNGARYHSSGEEAAVSQQLAEMFPLILNVIQGLALYFISFSWPVEFRVPFDFAFWPFSFNWIWSRMDNITILLLQLILCLVCVLLSRWFLAADEATFQMAVRRIKVAMIAYHQCIDIVLRQTLSRLRYENVSEDQIRQWTKAIAEQWKPIRRSDLREIPGFEEESELLLVDALVGVLPRPPEDALESHITRFILMENLDLDQAGIQGVCGAIRSGVPLHIVLSTNLQKELTTDQLKEFRRTIRNLVFELSPQKKQLKFYLKAANAGHTTDGTGQASESSDEEGSLRSIDSQKQEEMMYPSTHAALTNIAQREVRSESVHFNGDPGSSPLPSTAAQRERRSSQVFVPANSDDGADQQVGPETITSDADLEYRDPDVEAVNDALGTDLPQPPLNGKAPWPMYEITLESIDNPEEAYVVCDDGEDEGTTEEDALVRASNSILRHPEHMVGFTLSELPVWKKKDYHKAKTLQRLHTTFSRYCLLRPFAKFVTKLEPERYTLNKAVPFKRPEGGLCMLSGSFQQSALFKLQMTDEEPGKCPKHKKRLVPAAEDRHYTVRTVEGRLPYQCVHENSFALKSTRSGDWRSVAPCRNEELLVCPDDRCCFAVCVACADLSRRQRFLTKVQGLLYTIKHMKTSFGPLLVLIIMQALLLPVTLNCIRMLTCSREFKCEFPLCYSTNSLSFYAALGLALLLFVVFRIGLAFFWFVTLQKRRSQLAQMHKDNVRWWAWFLGADRSTLATLYRKYEYRFIALDPVLSLCYQVGVATAASVTVPDTALQMGAIGAVEVLSGAFLAVTNPFIDPWLDTLAKLGNTHQMLQLAYVAFHKARTYDDRSDAMMAFFMISTALLYLLLVLFILYKTVLKPWLVLREANRAAGVVRREKIFVNERDSTRALHSLKQLLVEKIRYFGEDHFQVLITKANVMTRLKDLSVKPNSDEGPMVFKAEDLEEGVCTCWPSSVKEREREVERLRKSVEYGAWFTSLKKHLATLIVWSGSLPHLDKQSQRKNSLGFERQRLTLVGEQSVRNLIHCMIPKKQELFPLLVHLVLSTRGDRTMKIAGGNALYLLVELGFPFFRLDLSKIYVPFASLEGVHLNECSLRGANLTGCSFLSSVFVRCDLSKTVTVNARFGWKQASSPPLKKIHPSMDVSKRGVSKKKGLHSSREVPLIRSGTVARAHEVLDLSMAPGSGNRVVVVVGDGSVQIWDAVTGDLQSAESVAVPLPPIPQRASKKKNRKLRKEGDESEDPEVVATSSESSVPGRTLDAPDNLPSVFNAGSVSPKRPKKKSKNKRSKKCSTENSVLVNPPSQKIVMDVVAFSPDGRFVVSAGSNTIVYVWRTFAESTQLAAQPFLSFEGHGAKITSVGVTPDGKRAYSASLDGTLKLWDIQLEVEMQSLPHDSALITAEVNVNNRFMATGSSDGTVTIWLLERGTIDFQSKAAHASVDALAFSPTGIHLATGGPRSLRLWIASSGRQPSWDTYRLQVWKTTTRDADVACVAFSPDGTRLASGCNDNWLYLWDVYAKVPLSRLQMFQFDKVKFSHDGLRILTVNDEFLYVWDRPHQRYRSTLFSPRSISSGVAVHPTRPFLVVGATAGILDYYDLSTGKWMENDEHHGSPISAVSFSLDGNYLVTSEEEPGSSVVVRTANPQHSLQQKWKLPTLANPTEACAPPVFALSFDSKSLLVAEVNHLSAYVLARQAQNAAMDLVVGIKEHVTAVCFANDSVRVVIGMSSGKLSVVAVVGSKFRDHRPLGSHGSSITAIECHRSQLTAVTVGGDSKIRMWGLDSLTLLYEMTLTSPPQSLSIDLSEQFISVGTTDGKVLIYQASTLRKLFTQDLKAFDDPLEGGTESMLGSSKNLASHLSSSGVRRKLLSHGVQPQDAEKVSVHFSKKEGNWLITAESSGQVYLWDVDSVSGMILMGRQAGTAKTFDELAGFAETTDVRQTRKAHRKQFQENLIWSSSDPLLFRDCFYMRLETGLEEVSNASGSLWDPSTSLGFRDPTSSREEGTDPSQFRKRRRKSKLHRGQDDDLKMDHSLVFFGGIDEENSPGTIGASQRPVLQ